MRRRTEGDTDCGGRTTLVEPTPNQLPMVAMVLGLVLAVVLVVVMLRHKPATQVTAQPVKSAQPTKTPVRSQTIPTAQPADEPTKAPESPTSPPTVSGEPTKAPPIASSDLPQEPSPQAKSHAKKLFTAGE